MTHRKHLQLFTLQLYDMTTKEAKNIVGYILQWQFVLMGVIQREEAPEKIDLSKYSLIDFIKANNLVRVNNNRRRRIQQQKQNKGLKTKGVKQQMTIDERALAAVYVALHNSVNNQPVALIDDIVVGCGRAKYK